MDFTLHANTVINAPRAAVFDRIVDVAYLPEWNREIARVIDQPERLAVGAQWVVEIRAMHTHWKSRSFVETVDPHAGEFRYRSVTDNGNPSYADWQWQLTDDEHGTRVDVTMAAHPKTLFRRALASRIRPRSLQRAMNESLQQLRRDLSSTTVTTESTAKER